MGAGPAGEGRRRGGKTLIKEEVVDPSPVSQHKVVTGDWGGESSKDELRVKKQWQRGLGTVRP